MNSFVASCLGLLLVGVVDPQAGDRKKAAPDPAGKKAPGPAAKVPAAPGGLPFPGGQLPPGFRLPPGMKMPPGGMPMGGPPGGFVPPGMPANFKPPVGMPPNFGPPMGMRFAEPKKAELPKELIPALIESLKDPEHKVRQYGASSLVRIGKDAVEPLLALLKGKDAAQRANAAYVLGQMGAAAQEEALPLLIKALKDDAKEVRLRAAFAIERLLATGGKTNMAMGMGMAPMNYMNGIMGQPQKPTVALPADPGTVPPSGKEPAKKPDKENAAKPDKEPVKKPEKEKTKKPSND